MTESYLDCGPTFNKVTNSYNDSGLKEATGRNGFYGKWHSGTLCHLEYCPWSINCAQGYVHGDFEKEAKGRNVSFHVLCDREQRLEGGVLCPF